ncbi:MAG: hypothetical protein ACLFQ5_09445 [Oceanicaulis sp.]
MKDAIRVISGVIVMVLSGARDEAVARRGYEAFRARREETGARRVLFDVRLANTVARPEDLMDRARRFGAATPPCQVAILARALDGKFARIYRRALADTGHDVQVFTDVKEAEAWLSTPTEADRLYLV